MNSTEAKALSEKHKGDRFRLLPWDVQQRLRFARYMLEVEKTNAAEKRAACSGAEHEEADRSARLRLETVSIKRRDLPPAPPQPKPAAPKGKPAKADTKS